LVGISKLVFALTPPIRRLEIALEELAELDRCPRLTVTQDALYQVQSDAAVDRRTLAAFLVTDQIKTSRDGL
jgi:hypothetical protein